MSQNRYRTKISLLWNGDGYAVTVCSVPDAIYMAPDYHVDPGLFHDVATIARLPSACMTMPQSSSRLVAKPRPDSSGRSIDRSDWTMLMPVPVR
jgi:hypothetical protein